MKRYRLPIALTVLALLTASCKDESSLTIPQADQVDPGKFAVSPTGTCSPTLHAQLQEYLENDEGIIFQIFEETLDCSQTAVLHAAPASWGPGYDVQLVIPAGAVPSDYPGYPLVTFSLGVPAVGPGAGLTSVPYLFHPDGIQFQIPIQARLYWPPWAGAFTPEGSALIHLQTEIHDSGVHYRVDALAEPAAVLVSTDKALPNGCEFNLPHFSRWDVVDGDNDPIDPTLIATKDVTTDTACWETVNPDSSLALEVLR